MKRLILLWIFLFLVTGVMGIAQVDLSLVDLDVSLSSVDYDGYIVDLLVQRNPVSSSGGAPITGVEFILEDVEGDVKKYRQSYPQGFLELESKLIGIDYSDSGLVQIETIWIYPVGTLDSGNEIIGTVGESLDVLSENIIPPIRQEDLQEISEEGAETPEYLVCLDADFNGDGNVDISDMALVGAQWGTSGVGNLFVADANGDGSVDISDMALVGANWGNCKDKGACVLSSASWSTDTAMEGDTVQLSVGTTGDCVDVPVEFKIFENDFLMFDSRALIGPLDGVLLGGSASTSWIVENRDLFGNGEYYFVAELGSGDKIKSGILNVNEVDILGESYCVDSDDKSQGKNLFEEVLERGFITRSYIECTGEQRDEDCSFVVTAEDVCESSSVLVEFGCSNGLDDVKKVKCSQGCVDGICLGEVIDVIEEDEIFFDRGFEFLAFDGGVVGGHERYDLDGDGEVHQDDGILIGSFIINNDNIDGVSDATVVCDNFDDDVLGRIECNKFDLDGDGVVGASTDWQELIDNTEIRCGNGYLEVGEICDDGNGFSGDGCSGICEVEAFTFDCTPGEVVECDTGLEGICGTGQTICGADGQFGECQVLVNPGDEVEICDLEDNDCDGQINEDTYSTFYRDLDGDGYGDPNKPVLTCDGESSAGFSLVDDNTDCVDSFSVQSVNGLVFGRDINPGAVEQCDGIDNDCDGINDRDNPDFDNDGDGYLFCDDNPFLQDCNDNNANVHPGAVEICDYFYDNDCDGEVDEGYDQDGDGYSNCGPNLFCDQPGVRVNQNYYDCVDDPISTLADGKIVFGDWFNPGAPEMCDGLDNNCDCIVDNFLNVEECQLGGEIRCIPNNLNCGYTNRVNCEAAGCLFTQGPDVIDVGTCFPSSGAFGAGFTIADFCSQNTDPIICEDKAWCYSTIVGYTPDTAEEDGVAIYGVKCDQCDWSGSSCILGDLDNWDGECFATGGFGS